jgi:hypothetical protein
VDGDERIYTDLELLCYRGTYNVFSKGVALPAILVWGLGIPFFAFAILTKNKKDLNKEKVMEAFGFLYRGYKHEYYYWESIIMYRKIALIVIAVIIQNYGLITQVCPFSNS